jgi:hypothetical protein
MDLNSDLSRMMSNDFFVGIVQSIRRRITRRRRP